MNAQQLKDSIIQYAISGKILSNSFEDGLDIFNFVEEIKKDELNLKESDMPFELPNNWRWSFLGDVMEIARGGSPRPIKSFITDSKDGVNWIKIGDTTKGNKYITHTSQKIKPEGVSKSRYVKKGDFLLSNSMSFGRPYILDIDGCIHDGWLVLSQKKEVFNKNFLFYLLSSKMVFYQFTSQVSGAVVNNLNAEKVRKTLVPIPPLEVQAKITKKIEDLLQVINRLESSQDELKKLQIAFPNKLENSILHSAIQGKLVEQDPNDEPAAELLEQFYEKKEKLISEKVIKKEKTILPITEEEIPFDIPESWEWIRISEICRVNPKNQLEDEKEAGFIPMKLIEDGLVNNHSYETKKWGEIKKGYTHFQSGDIVIAKITPCFENLKSAIIKDLPNTTGAGTTELFVLRPYLSKVDKNYLLWLFKSPYFVKGGVSSFSGTAGQQRISRTFLENFLVPLPPINEQKKIVEKINKFINHIQKV